MVDYVQPAAAPKQVATRQALIEQYKLVRSFTEQLCEPLATEDYVVQSMPDVSPTKWHLAHVSWFWETFVLSAAQPGYTSLHPQYTYLFNSYYDSIGERHCRPRRGLISRPTVEETYQYRHYVDQHMLDLLTRIDEAQLTELTPIITLGLQHEQQHQELMLTDIKHVLACNPLHPAYLSERKHPPSSGSVPPLKWLSYEEGIFEIGHQGDGFAFDNECPRHRVFLNAFRLASRLVTNGEYLDFIESGGYSIPTLWLSEGWHTIQEQQWQAPLYWEKRDGQWHVQTLMGLRKMNWDEPVCHVSYYEADAYARWKHARLATEAEWEIAARDIPIEGNFVESGRYHPAPLASAGSDEQPAQMYGDVWEWTQSAYAPYPGYKPAPGAVGEYNGKFMCSQFVLRGGSCATPRAHVRSTYRNFFPPDARWQFTGIRLAGEV
ncbi:ergothioneine biosynthesis protein EgtB [Ktedonospora formicarum]|uniref:Ergothioneine biosynthesis protein EgtB n=1 Tax=Ktedonospora formicarum TaxID=2778364 RepID=A0A8J3HXD9_9CHLR|nr:ergothioneine biosynthesis protein EgtB [Ktedonospora formicarum]GHO42333.1 ergothioneine biosynthesis protein EgtB [Ktedonospora formicarum]